MVPGIESSQQMNDRKYMFIVDASYSHKREVTGIGLVIREVRNPKRRKGNLLEKRSESFMGVPANQWEEFAILRALQIAQKRGYRIVKVRCDYNQMRTKLKEDHQANRGHCRESIDGVILRLAKRFTEVKFAFQARRRNGEAHRLARIGAMEMEPQDAAPFLTEE